MLYENQGLESIKGIGEKIAANFSEMGIDTIKDLLEYYPSRHIDRGMISDTLEGILPKSKAFVRGKALSGGRTYFISKKFTKTVLYFECKSGRFSAVFYNQPYRKNSIIVGDEYVLYGTAEISNGGAVSLNPAQCERADKIVNLTEGLSGIYKIPQKSKITQNRLKSALKAALDGTEIAENIPFWISERLELPSRHEALEGIHFPESEDELTAAKRYILAGEFMNFLVSLMYHKSTVLKNRSRVIDDSFISEFLKTLPFEMTGAQKRALAEISEDMKKGLQMNRLLQGDVGSGKTAVAMAAAYSVIRCNFQAAFTAPTEILARQHYEKYRDTLKALGYESALIYSAMPKKERADVLRRLETGEISLLFGTHAVFSKDVKYHNLALIIIDEQHRYGVSQRAELEKKGVYPHVLVMSATPIPRTLALCFYKDLDVSVIDVLPAGRKKVATYLVDEKMEKRLRVFAKKILDQGQKVYVVCPAVDDEEMINVQAVYEEFKKGFAGYGVGYITGQMNKDEKIKAMEDFSSGKTNLLVATSLIEVGIDVPEATLMWVKGCERFGLSQLHQLRGRVGRSSLQSWCVLQMSEYSENYEKRLDILTKTNDGFKVATEDMMNRGSGDVFGYAQSGKHSFILEAAMSESGLFFEVNKICEELLSSERQRDMEYVKSILKNITTDKSIVLN
ncbi:MAG: ATP-dependent DNA helicase RecG [Eubacteriaceae bacterium]|nr:ATP-dependent DNA helicase RecG [Eubacteriaceae bacterium]